MLLRGATEDSAIAEQEERFRYQLWLDSERASMFFAEASRAAFKAAQTTAAWNSTSSSSSRPTLA